MREFRNRVNVFFTTLEDAWEAFDVKGRGNFAQAEFIQVCAQIGVGARTARRCFYFQLSDPADTVVTFAGLNI